MKYLALIAFVALVAGTQAAHRERRDLRDALLHNAHNLEQSLELAVKVLRETNRTEEADILASEEKQLKTLSAELLAIDPHHSNHHKLQQLEAKLAALEARVNHQLQKLSRSPELIRQLIIDNFGNFSEAVEEKIKELEQQDYQGFAEDLKGQLKKISALVEQLKATNEHKEILKLDEEIGLLSRRLSRDLDLLRRDLHAYNLIINSTQTLLADVEHVVGELKARNLTDAVELLKVDVEELVVVRDQLKREKSILIFDYLQEKLVDLEKRLSQKLVAIEKDLHSGHEHTPRDEPNDVFENSAELLNAARQNI